MTCLAVSVIHNMPFGSYPIDLGYESESTPGEIRSIKASVSTGRLTAKARDSESAEEIAFCSVLEHDEGRHPETSRANRSQYGLFFCLSSITI